MIEQGTRMVLSKTAVRLQLIGEPSRRAVWVASAIAGTVWAGVMLLRLLLGGWVGVGNNWDGDRLFCPLGLANDRPWDASQLAYVYPTWVEHTRYDEPCTSEGWGERYYSSQQLVLWMAKGLTPLLGLSGALDVRAVGLLCTLAFGVVTALLVALLPGPLWLRLAMTVGFGLVMCDSAFAGFFISPYSEPGTLIGLMLLCPALLLLWRRPRSSLGGIVLTTAVMLFTLTTKTQMISLLPVAMLALLWLPSARQKNDDHQGNRSGGSHRTHPMHRLRRWLVSRWPALIACALLCGVTAGFAATQPQRLNQQVWYTAVFVEMLPHSPDPLGDLKALGADGRLLSAMDSRMADGNSAARTPYWADYQRNVTPAKILLHYLSHPDRFIGKGARGVQAVTKPTLDNYLGSYPAGSGHLAYAKERRVVVVTTLFEFLQKAPALVPLMWLGTIILGALLATRTWARPLVRAVGRMTVCVVIALTLQFWLVMMTEGAGDIYKHMIPTGYLTAICIPLSAICFWLLYRRDYSAGPEQEQEWLKATVPSGRKPSTQSAPSLTNVSSERGASSKLTETAEHQ
ncbi:hypothetical protein AB0N62_41045 [Streptomyces sp. NPDC093982]|uniref:glycan biosynthesis hexose transferase WsfD n=1 Tax=Streptomyces sp. NPDC093982 TaxID=3155077 RepID=UPI00342959CE